jgi:nucleoside-diphosphate-sugar epimerase
LNILEGCRRYNIQHLIYASSSSVYGLNSKIPFSEKDGTAHPVSLYAATTWGLWRGLWDGGESTGGSRSVSTGALRGFFGKF